MFSLLQLTFWEKLEQLDQWMFLRLNNTFTNPVFDSVMPFLRNGMHWVPLYLFIFVFVIVNFKSKGGWWIVFFIVTVALTDMTGTYFFKHNFHRFRPCMDPDFFYQVRLLVKECSGGSSFTSNHAANHFGMATFFFITFRPVLSKWAWIGFAWAGLIAYAQVYVGVHYPFDVLCGALLGIAIGLLTSKLFNKRFGFTNFDNEPTVSS